MPPLVTAQEITELLSLLAASDQSFEELTRRFKDAWPLSNSDRLRSLCALLLLLQEGAIRQPSQRWAALHLLHSFTKAQPPGKNLFAPFLIQAVQDLERPHLERLFIQSLLQRNGPPPGPIAHVLSAAGANFLAPILSADELWSILRDRDADRRAQQSVGPESSGAHEAEGMLRLEEGGVPPPFIRPQPPMLPVQPGEIQWLHPQLPQTVRWDYAMGQERASLANMQQLFKQALKAPLLPTQQQQVLKELEEDRKLVLMLNLAPSSLPELVEHNPVIAIEVFLRLIQFGRGAEFLPALVGMEMSLHSMEVVNRLSTAIDLPLEFVHSYISNCIHSCRAAQEDKYVQTRRVRLVCVFLQSLIKNRIINVQDLFYEMQSFCIEFSRVREAAVLFRLLKTLENGNGEKSADGARDAASSSSAVV